VVLVRMRNQQNLVAGVAGGVALDVFARHPGARAIEEGARGDEAGVDRRAHGRCALEAAARSLRHAAGATPTSRLKARLSAASDP